MESILTSIKKLLGIEENYEHFDSDIIMHVNSTLAILTQLGVGPSSGFSIADKNQTWADFLGEELSQFEHVKTYIYMKVRMIFDPPTSGAAIESMNRMIQEFEWRLNVSADKTKLES